MKEFSITAIVVLYHSKHLLPSFLENIRDKIRGLEEIILVDNSSENLSEFNSPLVKVINPSKNIGYGAAINLGIKNAKNSIIVAMNPDVEITQWELSADWIFDNLIIVSGIPNEWISIRKFPSLICDILRLSLQNLARPFWWVGSLSGSISLEHISKPKQVDWVSGALMITNKKTMNRIGGFDEEYFLFYEEVDLCKRASSLAIPRYILPSINFNLNIGFSSSLDVDEIKFVSEIQSAKKYHSKYTNKYICLIIFFLFKMYCFFIASSLTMIHVLVANDKLFKKAKQYFLYAKYA